MGSIADLGWYLYEQPDAVSGSSSAHAHHGQRCRLPVAARRTWPTRRSGPSGWKLGSQGQRYVDTRAICGISKHEAHRRVAVHHYQRMGICLHSSSEFENESKWGRYMTSPAAPIFRKRSILLIGAAAPP